MRPLIPPSHIAIDPSGTMRNDVFYRVSTCEYLTWDHLSPKERQGYTALHPRSPRRNTGYGPDWLTVHAYQHQQSTREVMLCTDHESVRHQVQPFVEHLEGDLYGGPFAGDFVIDATLGWLVVTAAFADLIRKTQLTGYDLRPFKIIVNQSVIPTVELFHLQPIGRNCERPPSVVRGENRCPHCGRARVVCETCGYRWFTCPHCNQQMYATPASFSGAEDKRLLIEPPGCNGGILEGHRWDGTDFVGSHDHIYFSRRAFEWMTTRHVGPLLGMPARFCTDGVDAECQKAIDKVIDVSGVER